MTTTNKGLAEPSNGSLNWDTPLNANFGIIDSALGGVTNLNVTSITTTQTLTTAQYQSMILAFTGTLSANLIYQVPSGVGGQWLLINGTTGAFTITFRTAAAGATVVVPTGYNTTAYSNGTDIYTITSLTSPIISNAIISSPTISSPTISSPAISAPTVSGTITITGGTQNWTVIASGANLTFAFNGVNKMRLDSSGDLSVTGNVTAYGTIT